MRYTRNRGYPAEQRHVDEAGSTLHGGVDGTKPTLADAVDADVHTVAGRVDGHDMRFSEQAAMLADVMAFVARFPNLRIQTGRSTLSFAATDAYTHPITFPVAFGAVPVIVANIDAAPAATARWDVRAISPSATGFTFFVYANASGAATAWSNVSISWLALSLNG